MPGSITSHKADMTTSLEWVQKWTRVNLAYHRSHDMTTTLEWVQKWTSINLSHYRSHPHWEDAIQEALLHAWKDIESGEYEPFHILNRAKQRAWAFMHNNKRATGSPPLSRDGIGTAESDAQMWKIAHWRREYWELHDKWPSYAEVAKVFDISTSSVERQIMRHREGRYNHAVYVPRGDGHRTLAPSYFNPISIDGMSDSLNDEGKDSETYNQIRFSTGDMEDIMISNLDFYRILDQVSEESRKVLFLVYVMGYTQPQVGKELGYKANHNQNGYKRIRKAHKEVKEILDV